MDDRAASRGVLLPAVYLACSWTWVLGMFFPVLMISDFGWPGWIAFVVPNCLGAMSVGFFLRSPGHARRFAAQHREAIWLFSVVTVAFHAFFIAHLPAVLLTAPPLTHRVAFVVIAAVMIALACRRRSLGYMLSSAPGVFALSLLTMVLAESLYHGQSLGLPPVDGTESRSDLVAAVLPLALGFGLCPYLDATFLRIRHSTGERDGRRAFALSFLFLFPLLVTCTLLYADALLGRRAIPLILGVHFYVQAQFTTSLHVNEFPGSRRRSVMLLAAAGAILLGALLPREHFRLSYELFMSAYALPFPVYLLAFGLPRMRIQSPGRRWTCFLVTIIAASPCYLLGYLGRQWLWLFPGVVLAVGIPFLFASLGARRNPR